MPRSLEEQLNGADPEPWIPENAGEFVQGEIEAVDTREGDYGEYKVVTLLTGSGDVLSVAGFGTVLKGKFESLTSSDIGRELGVKFVGVKQNKLGKDYKDYKVLLSPQSTPALAGALATGDEFSEDE